MGSECLKINNPAEDMFSLKPAEKIDSVMQITDNVNSLYTNPMLPRLHFMNRIMRVSGL